MRLAWRIHPQAILTVTICTSVGASGVLLGVAITTHTRLALLAPAGLLFLLAVLGVMVVRRSLGGTAWSIYLFGLVGLGVVQDFLYGQTGNSYSPWLRLTEAMLLIGSCVLALTRSSRRPPRYLWLVPVLLVASAAVSCILLHYPLSLLLEGIQTYLRFTVLALAVSIAPFREKDRMLCEVWAAGIVIGIAALALLQFLTGEFMDFFRGAYALSIRGGITRAIGVFPWPNELALFLGTWFFVFYVQRNRSRLYRVAAVLAFAAIVTSLTRWTIATVVGLAILHDVSIRRTRSALVLIAGTGLVMWGLSGAILPGLTEDVSANLATTAPRGMFLVKGLDVWRDAPWFGVGYGRYGSSWAQNIEGTSLLSQYGISATEKLATTDSFAAALLPEFGIVGLGLLAIYFVKVGMTARRLWVRPEARAYAMVVTFALLSTVNSAHVLYAPHTLVVWISIGLLARWASTSNVSPVLQSPAGTKGNRSYRKGLLVRNRTRHAAHRNSSPRPPCTGTEACVPSTAARCSALTPDSPSEQARGT